jgi:Fur family zinc uptake transcriptional regulator
MAAKPKRKSNTSRTHAGDDHAEHSHGETPELGVNESHVQKILSKSKMPLSAYDIIPLMAKQLGHAVAPPTVYRALQNLTSQGVATRIESRNAYILCRHQHEHHDCLFFICRQCGTTTEAPDHSISQQLRKEAESLGFGINRQILEVIGLCKNCAAA